LIPSKNISLTLSNRIKPGLIRMISVPEMIIIIPIILLFIVSAILSPAFLTTSNLISLVRNIAIMGIVAVVFTLLLVIKGLDLSVGALVGLSGVVLGKTATTMHLPLSLALLITVCVGLSVGIINGFLSVKVGIPSIIVTLGMQFILRGAAFIIVGASYIMSNIPDGLVKFGNFKIGPLSIEILLFVIFTLIIDFILRNTVLGRRIKLSGFNPSVARLHGVNYQNISIIIYVVTSLAATLAGILFTSRMGSSMPLAGYQWEIQIIAGCVLGGASIYGGRGSAIGTLFGIIFMAMLLNIMVILKVSSDWQYFAIGMFMILAIMLDNSRKILINKLITV
jgi:ribose transport system permease protein